MVNFNEDLSLVDGYFEEKAKNENEGKQSEFIPFYDFITLDSDKHAKVTVRMLPGIENNLPFFEEVTHGGKEKGENGHFPKVLCRKLKGEPCIYCELEKMSWDIKDEALRKAFWFEIKSNVKTAPFYFYGVVIKDRGKEDNVGRIFKFRLSEKDFNPILKKMKGDAEDGIKGETIYSLKTGRNFIIDMYKKDGFNKYDITFVDSQTVLDMKTINQEDLNNLKILKETAKGFKVTLEEDISKFIEWLSKSVYAEDVIPLVDRFYKMHNMNSINNEVKEEPKKTLTEEVKTEETKNVAIEETKSVVIEETKKEEHKPKKKKDEPMEVSDLF